MCWLFRGWKIMPSATVHRQAFSTSSWLNHWCWIRGQNDHHWEQTNKAADLGHGLFIAFVSFPFFFTGFRFLFILIYLWFSVLSKYFLLIYILSGGSRIVQIYYQVLLSRCSWCSSGLWHHQVWSYCIFGKLCFLLFSHILINCQPWKWCTQ